jgi:hypothetical protein
MRIPFATQSKTVAVGRGATSAQARHATAGLIVAVSPHDGHIPTHGLSPLEQPARLSRASFSHRYPPTPGRTKRLWESF